jgi:hypothetical protein
VTSVEIIYPGDDGNNVYPGQVTWPFSLHFIVRKDDPKEEMI